MSLADKYFKEEVNELLTNGFNDNGEFILITAGGGGTVVQGGGE